MLSYALAIAVAISSLVLFSTAFLMSKIHRKDDFLWSTVGLFYALVLWYCARNITGAVLLGQAAATVLIVSSSWQTIKLRRAIANPAQAAETKNFSVLQSINGLLKRKKPQVQPSTPPVAKAPTPKVTEQNIVIPETPANISEAGTKKVQDADIFNNNEANVSNDEPVVEGAEKTTSAIKDAPNSQVLPVETEPLPLPNKLPEVSQPAENQSATKDTPRPQPQPTENIQPDVQTENLSKTVANQEKDTATATTQEVEPTPEIIPPATAKSTQPKSALDSLETVEVAEVLEAESDRQSNNRDTDRFNIIEVTTTEINVTTEVIKTDQNQDSDSDFKEV